MPIRIASLRVKQVDRLVKSRAHRGLERGAEIIADYMRWEVSTRTVPYTPSTPGDPPHVKSGELLDSIFYDYDPFTFTAIIGSTSMHGYYTEFGASYDPRPWARPAFVDNMTTVAWALVRAF